MRRVSRQPKRLQPPADSAAMLDKVPLRTPPAPTRVIACPPRHQAKPADPCAMVIFGATGDLTKRLVVPALYNLSRSKVLPEQFALIGVARTQTDANGWRERLYDMLKSFVGHAGAEFNTDHIDDDAWARLADKMTYIAGDLTDPDLYERVRGALDTGGKSPWHPRQRPLLSRHRRSAVRRPWSTNSAKPSSPSKPRGRTAAAASGAGW